MTEPTTAADAAAKDSPTGAESTLSSDVRDLLAAIRDALDLPLPAVDALGGWEKRARLISSRAVAIRTAAAVAVRTNAPHVPTLTKSIREAIDSHPVSYPAWEPAQDGGAR
jgi:hypothetical protein